ncbi:MAG: PP2C family serine/threonine-protein phosphatase [Victivallaceae bacterium]|nr:protein phosphatase 2C domain-containing protein [Victivallaceae bacterium]
MIDLSILWPWSGRHMRIAGESNVGLVRSNNEDSYVFQYSPGDRNALLVVADGIGGHAHGEVASSMCCDVMAREWKKNRAGTREDTATMRDFLEWMIESANTAIYRINSLSPQSRPMGCTVVAAVITPHALLVANAGDSRCYGLCRTGLRQLTCDHTLRAAMIARGGECCGENLPQSNIINKAVGPASRVSPALCCFERRAFQRIMLCSDGLTGMVPDDEIEAVLTESADPRLVNEQLVCAALAAGGRDNVTVVTAFC